MCGLYSTRHWLVSAAASALICGWTYLLLGYSYFDVSMWDEESGGAGRTVKDTEN